MILMHISGTYRNHWMHVTGLQVRIKKPWLNNIIKINNPLLDYRKIQYPNHQITTSKSKFWYLIVIWTLKKSWLSSWSAKLTWFSFWKIFLFFSQKLAMGMEALKFIPNSGYLAKTHERRKHLICFKSQLKSPCLNFIKFKPITMFSSVVDL